MDTEVLKKCAIVCIIPRTPITEETQACDAGVRKAREVSYRTAQFRTILFKED